MRSSITTWRDGDSIGHRFPIADLIISASAKQANLVALHADGDFERIAAVGGAVHERVVPRGSV